MYMDPAKMQEVFKRLGEKKHKFLDESHQEMPLPEPEEPLFLRRNDGS
jgi:hypothetical protein